MNLGQYRVEVKDRLGVPPADGTVSNESLDRAVNGALKHIASQRAWPWLFVEDPVNLAAGAREFFPPSTWRTTTYLADDEGELHLQPIWDMNYYRNARPGRPAFYAVIGDRILLAPPVDAGRTLRHGYYRNEALLVADTDAPLLPDAHSEWLISEAGIRIAIRSNKSDRLAVLREEAAIAKAATLDDVRRTLGLPRIRRTKPSIWQEV